MYVCYSNNKCEYLIIIHIHVITNKTTYHTHHIHIDNIRILIQHIKYIYHILVLVQQYTISNSTVYTPLSLPPPPRRRAGHTSRNAPQQTPKYLEYNYNQ